MKFKASRDLVKFALEHKTYSPTKLREIILRERNKAVTPESITMWFKRHPQIYAELQKQIVEEEKPKEEVSPSIFENGTFEQLPSIANWIKEMGNRILSSSVIENQVNALKRVCRGQFTNWKVDLVAEGLWSFKHPDRLTLSDANAIELILRKKGFDTACVRMPLRNFLESKGIVVGKKISGAKSRGFGTLADLYIPHEKAKEIIAWVKGLNFEAGVIDEFLYETGTRITASLNTLIENIHDESYVVTVKEIILENGKKVPYGDNMIMLLNALNQQFNIDIRKEPVSHRYIKVFDKGRKSIHPQGHMWKKEISPSLWSDMQKLIGTRQSGRIFTMNEDEMSNINRTAFHQLIPELGPKLQHPNHAWRHFHFQHTLRENGYNYGISAAIGGSTARSLEESYGRPPDVVMREMHTTIGRMFA